MFFLVDGHEQNHQKALRGQSVHVFCYPSSPLTRACPASNCYALSIDGVCIRVAFGTLCEQFLRECGLPVPSVLRVPATLPVGLKLDVKYLKHGKTARTLFSRS